MFFRVAIASVLKANIRGFPYDTRNLSVVSFAKSQCKVVEYLRKALPDKEYQRCCRKRER
jgi:hypothetical protein